MLKKLVKKLTKLTIVLTSYEVIKVCIVENTMKLRSNVGVSKALFEKVIFILNAHGLT